MKILNMLKEQYFNFTSFGLLQILKIVIKYTDNTVIDHNVPDFART